MPRPECRHRRVGCRSAPGKASRFGRSCRPACARGGRPVAHGTRRLRMVSACPSDAAGHIRVEAKPSVRESAHKKCCSHFRGSAGSALPGAHPQPGGARRMGHTCAPRPCARAVAAGRRLAGRRSSHGRCVAGKQPERAGGGGPRRGDSAVRGAIAYPPQGDSTAARLLSTAPHGAARASEVPPLVLRSPPKVPHLDAPPATHELLSGSARLLVGTDGSLVLFRTDKPDQPSVQGRAVLPWFLARQGAVATRAEAEEGSDSLELRWGNSAMLRVTPVGEGGRSSQGPWTQVRAFCWWRLARAAVPAAGVSLGDTQPAPGCESPPAPLPHALSLVELSSPSACDLCLSWRRA